MVEKPDIDTFLFKVIFLAALLSQPRYLMPLLSKLCIDKLFHSAKVEGVSLGGYMEFIRSKFAAQINHMSAAFEHESEKCALGSFAIFE